MLTCGIVMESVVPSSNSVSSSRVSPTASSDTMATTPPPPSASLTKNNNNGNRHMSVDSDRTVPPGGGAGPPAVGTSAVGNNAATSIRPQTETSPKNGSPPLASPNQQQPTLSPAGSPKLPPPPSHPSPNRSRRSSAQGPNSASPQSPRSPRSPRSPKSPRSPRSPRSPNITQHHSQDYPIRAAGQPNSPLPVGVTLSSPPAKGGSNSNSSSSKISGVDAHMRLGQNPSQQSQPQTQLQKQFETSPLNQVQSQQQRQSLESPIPQSQKQPVHQVPKSPVSHLPNQKPSQVSVSLSKNQHENKQVSVSQLPQSQKPQHQTTTSTMPQPQSQQVSASAKTTAPQSQKQPKTTNSAMSQPQNQQVPSSAKTTVPQSQKQQPKATSPLPQPQKQKQQMAPSKVSQSQNQQQSKTPKSPLPQSSIPSPQKQLQLQAPLSPLPQPLQKQQQHPSPTSPLAQPLKQHQKQAPTSPLPQTPKQQPQQTLVSPLPPSQKQSQSQVSPKSSLSQSESKPLKLSSKSPTSPLAQSKNQKNQGPKSPSLNLNQTDLLPVSPSHAQTQQFPNQLSSPTPSLQNQQLQNVVPISPNIHSPTQLLQNLIQASPTPLSPGQQSQNQIQSPSSPRQYSPRSQSPQPPPLLPPPPPPAKNLVQSSVPVSIAVSGSTTATTGGAINKFVGVKQGAGHSRGIRVPLPPPPHRLIRQHSLAAVLGLFKGRDEKGNLSDITDDWPTVREEPEELERSSGSNNSRSHSIPSTSVPNLPQVNRRKRRSSCHTDLSGVTLTTSGGAGALPLAIKKKTLSSDAAAATVGTRRCSLTLPYATLYGSWQSTISTPGSRHGSNEIPSSVQVAPRRAGGSILVEMTNIGGPVTQSMPNSRSGSTIAAVTQQGPTGTCVSMTSSSSTAPLLPHPSGGPYHDHFGDPLNPLTETITQLLACSLQKVPMKDFGSEVRATMDIVHFLAQATLVLDVVETSLEGITDMLLTKLLEKDEPLCSVAEAKSILFTHDTSSSNEKDSLSKVHLLARTIQGTASSENGSFDYDQSWICALGNLPSLQRRHVAIARLKHPANMGRTSKQVKLFILVLCPSKEKGTKNSLETGRTFATIFADMDFRQRLLEATNEEDFKNLIIKHSQELAEEQQMSNDKRIEMNHERGEEFEYQEKRCVFARGLREDFHRRIPHYLSDYRDGVVGHKTVQKVVSTTFFLYFACILPAIAFGVLNDHNTHGKIDVKRVIIGQVIGGVFWGVFSGQPLLIQLTTAPLAIYIKIIYYICDDFNLDFNAMYCAVGLWNSFFLVIYSLFDVSRLMRWSTRSTEEIFALFISIAFTNDAFNDVSKNFRANYYSDACQGGSNSTVQSNHTAYTILRNSSDSYIIGSGDSHGADSNATLTLVEDVCTRENSILYLLLMFGTLWLGVMLYNFNKTPYLNANKREALADYALPVAVIVLSFIGSYIFRDVHLEHFRYDDGYDVFTLAPLNLLPLPAVFATMGLGFSLSMLFFMDQNIGSAMVNNPCNKLKKGPAYHLDLMVVALMNGFLSIFGLPWMHACLPHSPLHVRSLADVEERVEQGHVYEIIVKVRETRLTGLFSNILIGLSIFLLPYPLAYIPTAVLDGLFLYMAVTALNGNQMFERISLFFMEQAAYPPNHYIRRVPQRKIHKFTGLQIVQLVVMCSFGFAPWPYMKMMFPVALLLLLPIRHKLVPLVIEDKYLAALDGEHQ